MRSLFAVCLLVAFTVPALGADDSKGNRERKNYQISPEAEQCVESCKSTKDAAAQEMCMAKCPYEAPKRHDKKSSAEKGK